MAVFCLHDSSYSWLAGCDAIGEPWQRFLILHRIGTCKDETHAPPWEVVVCQFKSNYVMEKQDASWQPETSGCTDTDTDVLLLLLVQCRTRD